MGEVCCTYFRVISTLLVLRKVRIGDRVKIQRTFKLRFMGAGLLSSRYKHVFSGVCSGERSDSCSSFGRFAGSRVSGLCPRVSFLVDRISELVARG